MITRGRERRTRLLESVFSFEHEEMVLAGATNLVGLERDDSEE